MASTLFGLVAGLAATTALAAPSLKQLSHREAAGIPLTDKFAPMRRVMSSQTSYSGAGQKLMKSLASSNPSMGMGTPKAAENQIEYIMDVTIGGKNLSLIVDTGSSDTWVAKSTFQCVDQGTRRVLPVSSCGFGPLYSGDFQEGQITGEEFEIQYGTGGGGPWLQGVLGYSDIDLAGITITKQEIALAEEGAWQGDAISSGIVGLGLAALTEAIVGGNRVEHYDPIVITMQSQGIDPIFALGLSRDDSQSFLSLGGVPNMTTGPFATSPILKMTDPDTAAVEYARYIIEIEGIYANSSKGDASYTTGLTPMLIDSGTTLDLFPTAMAQKINSLFNPPATYVEEEGQWFVPCTATPPSLSIKIGGVTINHDPKSLILPEVTYPGEDNYCSTGIGTAGDGGDFYILGDTFMQSLVTVFDLKNMEIKFANRQ